MPRMKVVFFDAGGTLIQPREPVWRVYAAVARRFGVDAPEAEVAVNFRRALDDASTLAFGPGRRPDELRALERQWWRGVVAATFEGLGEFTDFDACFGELYDLFGRPSAWLATAGATDALGALRGHGREIGIISNFDHRLYAILKGLELDHYFDSITISPEAGYAKPSAEIFRTALTRHSANPDQALHVGDSEHADVQGARAAGIATVLLDRSLGDRAELDARHARIGSLTMVARVLSVLEVG